MTQFSNRKHVISFDMQAIGLLRESQLLRSSSTLLVVTADLSKLMHTIGTGYARVARCENVKPPKSKRNFWHLRIAHVVIFFYQIVDFCCLIVSMMWEALVVLTIFYEQEAFSAVITIYSHWYCGLSIQAALGRIFSAGSATPKHRALRIKAGGAFTSQINRVERDKSLVYYCVSAKMSSGDCIL